MFIELNMLHPTTIKYGGEFLNCEKKTIGYQSISEDWVFIYGDLFLDEVFQKLGFL